MYQDVGHKLKDVMLFSVACSLRREGKPIHSLQLRLIHLTFPVKDTSEDPELLKHANLIAERWDLSPKTHFQAEVQTLDRNRDEGCWLARTDRGDMVSCSFRDHQ